MPTQVQFRRGNTSQNQAFTGANGEITIDVNKKTIIVHDGATPGGYPLAHNTAFDVANAAYTNANSILSLAQAAYDRANSSNDVLYVAAAFDKANAALANVTNTVFQGNLTITGALTVGMNTTVITETSIIAQSLFIGNSTSYVAVSSGTSTNAAFDVANAAFDKANAANVLAYDTGIGANAYAESVGSSANNYAGAMANSANVFTGTVYTAVNSAFDVVNAAFGQANTLKTSANAYADLVGTSANNYAGYMANSANSYAASLTPDLSPAFNKANSAYTVANGAFDEANSVATGANAYATAVGTAGNTYAATVGTSANNYSNATFVKLTSASQTITGDFSITGNLFIGGNTTTVSANNLIVNDSLIYLANNNLSDILDIGFVGSYDNATAAHVHTGFFRDHSSKQYYLFQGFDANPEIINDIIPYSNNMVNAVLVADLNTSNLTLGSANAIVWITSAYDKANAAFDRGNTSAQLAFFRVAANGSNLDAVSNADTLTVTSSNNIILIANSTNDSIQITQNPSGVTATTYGGATQIPVFVVDTYGRLTSASNVAVSGMDYAYVNTVWGVANSKVDTITSNSTSRIWANSVTVGSVETVYVDLATSGVTATTYGGATQIPVLAVDAYGRITGASNVAVSGMDYNYVNTSTTAANNYLGSLANTGYATQTMTVTTLTDGATINWDASVSRMATVTIGATGRTMANPTNLKAGSYILIVKQDAGGSKTITTWGSAFKWPAAVAPTLSTTASTTDVFSFWCDGTNLYGTYIPDCR